MGQSLDVWTRSSRGFRSGSWASGTREPRWHHAPPRVLGPCGFGVPPPSPQSPSAPRHTPAKDAFLPGEQLPADPGRRRRGRPKSSGQPGLGPAAAESRGVTGRASAGPGPWWPSSARVPCEGRGVTLAGGEPSGAAGGHGVTPESHPSGSQAWPLCGFYERWTPRALEPLVCTAPWDPEGRALAGPCPPRLASASRAGLHTLFLGARVPRAHAPRSPCSSRAAPALARDATCPFHR